MFKKLIYFIAMFMVVSFCSIDAYAQSGSTHKIKKQPSSIMVSSTNNNQEEQRPVLTVTPREIDLGAIKPGEIAFGEYGLKNLAPGELKWSISCPDDWESVADKTLKGTASQEPTYLRLELATIENSGNVTGEKARIATYRTSMKMEAAGKELVCQKNLRAGQYREGILMTSTGGQRTVFLDFRIHALQEIPSISLNPQRLDLGVQLPGKIISKRIELTNRGREMLKWSVVSSEAKSNELMKELQKERYFSFQNEEPQEPGKYVTPEHLKDAMELMGKWTVKNGYPVSKGAASAIKFRFNGTGLSIFLQSHTEDGSCSIYLDEVRLDLPDVLSGEWDKKELLIAEGLTDGPHTVTVVVKEGSLELEGVKVFGKAITRGPKGWITVYPVSGTTMRETDYINVKVDTSYFVPGYYGDQIFFKSNVGEAVAEVFVDVLPDAGSKVIDVYLYSKDHDYLLTMDPQAESRRLIQNGYIKEGIAFRLFAPQTPGTMSFYRWYNPRLKDHFYHYDRTGGGKKLDGYVYEGIIGNIATSRMTNTRELYRWFNPSTKKHYYSTNPKGATGKRRGYRFEGIAGYVR
ncbi:MAG TPA: hypothetical protein PLP18_06830 [Smithellaceae bacterium]|nr:hypothetical protein [Smithellaceae bacterium]